MPARWTLLVFAFGCCSFAFGGRQTERIAKWHAVKLIDVWYGGERTVFDFEGYDAWVVEPSESVKPEQGMPWMWTMRWREAFVPRTGVPQLLKKGWHYVSIDTFARKMDEKGLEVSERFQRFLVDELGFAPKAHLVGMSWGGFFSIWCAAHYPVNVAKIYLDCPLLNLGGVQAFGRRAVDWPVGEKSARKLDGRSAHASQHGPCDRDGEDTHPACIWRSGQCS